MVFLLRTPGFGVVTFCSTLEWFNLFIWLFVMAVRCPQQFEGGRLESDAGFDGFDERTSSVLPAQGDSLSDTCLTTPAATTLTLSEMFSRSCSEPQSQPEEAFASPMNGADADSKQHATSNLRIFPGGKKTLLEALSSDITEPETNSDEEIEQHIETILNSEGNAWQCYGKLEVRTCGAVTVSAGHEDLLQRIFRYVPAVQLVVMRRVCKRWRAVCDHRYTWSQRGFTFPLCELAKVCGTDTLY